MKNAKRLVAFAAIALVLTGCYSSSEDPDKKKGGHPTEGPHEGALIELGDEEYHAEFLPDHDTKTATVWILDSSAKKAVPIDAETIKLFIEKKDKSDKVEIEMKADREESDPKDKTSRFTAVHEMIAEERPYIGEVIIEIDGKQFRGKLDETKEHTH